eukprot:1228718-Alexandrium_andersonii.AAC.1
MCPIASLHLALLGGSWRAFDHADLLRQGMVAVVHGFPRTGAEALASCQLVQRATPRRVVACCVAAPA